MSIVRMKRLRLLAMAEDREKIMRLLSHIGAVELSGTDEEEAMFGDVTTDSEALSEALDSILDAEAIARKYGKLKKGMFSPRVAITEKRLFSSELTKNALDAARAINENERSYNELCDKRSKLITLSETYMPWQGLPLPLDTPEGKSFETFLFTVPAGVSFSEVEEKAKETSELFEFYEISEGAELRYLLGICHKETGEKIREVIKELGASLVRFRGVNVTASEKVEEIKKEIKLLDKQIDEARKNLSVDRETYDLLLTAHDAIATRLTCEVESEKGKLTKNTFYIEGWAPAREEKMLSEFFDVNGCAYEFADPVEGEEPPTLTYNSKLIAPFEVVTNMYSAPAYTGIDPNPTMAPFFAIFFGIMLSDAGYGLLLMLAGIFALLKLKPRGGFKSFMQLAVICGASTVIWGALFGGFFGDAIPSVYLLFTGKTFPHDMALWFNPTNDPMTMLIFSLALGGVQIVAGMAVKFYMMIRDGEVWAAIFDIGLWWVVFAGAITCIFNTGVGLYILLVGVIGLVLTQGRAKKNIIMKFFSGVLSLYDVTGYFSDILSYSRLLALSLSTAVVGTVVNTMGILTGPVGFFVVFLIGHVFNIAINLVGSFVHSARLQYVEYFGKFYESGGRQFAPLTIKTKNIDIIKEEN